MRDDLYEHDILSWSAHQADLLRRVARGEQVNEVDWDNVAEEIEGVGLSELHSVESFLDLLLVHLLKVHGWPDSPSVALWRGEMGPFQRSAAKRFSPSMRQRLDIPASYRAAAEQLQGLNYDNIAPAPWPTECPFTLDDLLTAKRADLEARLAAGP
jgi:hypothetical protein